MPVQTERMLQFSLGFLLGGPVLWLGVSLLLNLVNHADPIAAPGHVGALDDSGVDVRGGGLRLPDPGLSPLGKALVQKTNHLTGLANPEVEFTRYEAEVAKVFHKELQELVDRYL